MKGRKKSKRSKSNLGKRKKPGENITQSGAKKKKQNHE